MSDEELIDVEVRVLYETERAFRVTDGAKEVWLPKSRVEMSEDHTTVTLPEWLAVEKELI